MADTDEIISGAVFAALGCTSIDRRSPHRMQEAADQIAKFVSAGLSDAGYKIVRARQVNPNG